MGRVGLGLQTDSPTPAAPLLTQSLSETSALTRLRAELDPRSVVLDTGRPAPKLESKSSGSSASIPGSPVLAFTRGARLRP